MSQQEEGQAYHEILFSFRKEKFNKIYRPYIFTNHEYELFYGGSGSGKSYFAAQKKIVKCLNEPYFRLIFCRKNSTDIRKSQYQLFKDLIHEYKLEGYFFFKDTSMDIRCFNGNMMLSAGMNDPQKIKSVQKPTDIWCEEATEFELEDFSQLNKRLRAEKGQKLQFTMTFNPEFEDHWLNKTFFNPEIQQTIDLSKIYDSPGKLIVETTYLDNDMIDQEAYEAKLDMDRPDTQTVYKFGKWGQIKTGMEYYPSFSDATHVVSAMKYQPELPLHITYDFNVAPYITLEVSQIEILPFEDWQKTNQELARVLLQHNPQLREVAEVRWIDEYCLAHPKNTTLLVSKAFYKDYYENSGHNTGLFYYGDASGKNRSTREIDEKIKHDFDIVRATLGRMLNAGSDRTVKKNPSVIRRRDFILDSLEGRIPIVNKFSPKCVELIRDFRYLKQSADGTKLKQVVEDEITEEKYQKHGHTSDALEYLECRAFSNVFKRYEKRR